MKIASKSHSKFSQLLPALLVLVFVVIAGSRDSLAESFIKSETDAPPILIILLFSFSAISLGFIVGVFSNAGSISKTCGDLRDVWFSDRCSLICLNVVTAGAYILTIIAIGSNLGAAYNSFIDYGITPVITLFFGVAGIGEKFQIRRIGAVLVACIGIFLVSVVDSSNTDTVYVAKKWGIVASVCSAFFGAGIHYFNKKMVGKNVDPWAILTSRMLLVFLLSSLLLYFSSTDFVLSDHLILLPYAVIFFAFPLYLLLVAFKSIELGQFAVALYLVPVVTTIVSSFLGRVDFQLESVIGVIAVITAMLISNNLDRYVKGGFEKIWRSIRSRL